GRTTEQRLQYVRRIVVIKVLGKHGGAGDRLDRRRIDADNDATLRTLDRDLGPAARRGAEIDHPCAGLEKAQLVIQLQELEGGTRAVAALPGFGNVRIVELALQPALRGDRAAPRRLEAHAGPPSNRPARWTVALSLARHGYKARRQNGSASRSA